MTHLLRGLGLASTLVLVSSLAVVPQAKSQSPSAYVYVQDGGPAGVVYGYSASSSGQLTAIPGSPFKPGTQIVGATNSHFFTIGKTLLHSYALGSNGAIGAQESQIAFLDYSGGSCDSGSSGTASAVLDHSGKYIYVVLQSGNSNPGGDTCEDIQSYIINSDGSFTFDGDTEQSSLSGGYVGVPSILGDETYAYADNGVATNNAASSQDILPLRRESNGTLEIISARENDPSPGYYTYHPDADPNGDYVVIQLYPSSGLQNPQDTHTPPQLGSYTVDSQGDITTTNTSSNMPASSLMNPGSVFSPDGKWYVLYADNGTGTGTSGMEIYNFNGAAPMTLYQKVLTGTPIDQVGWDTSGHMYAISKAESHMYVFNVSSTSVTVDPSVPVSGPVSLVVLSQTATSGGGGTGGSGTGGSCTAPTSEGVNVCSPSENATVTSPVQIDAAANVTGGVYRFELWNGSTKLASVSNSDTMDQPVTLSPGTYHLIFDAYNTSGDHQKTTVDITVSGSTSGGGGGGTGGGTGGGGTGGSCTAPSSQGVNVCTPDENSTVTSPVQMDAAANVTGGVYRFELWNGSTKLASVDNSNTFDQSVALAPGTYHLTFDARSSSGDHQYGYRDITVTSAGGTAATQYSAPVFSTQTAWTTAGNGQIKVDTQGMVDIQLSNAAAGKSYAVQFCEAVNPAHSNLPSSCMAITTVTTDGSGSASTSLKFPQPGDWAGDFVFVDNSGNTDYATSIAAGYGSYMGTLMPDSQTNGGLVTTSSPQLPLTSGTVTVSGSVATYTVKGASPNAYYVGNESETTYIDSSGTYDIASMTTDSQGDGTMTGSLSNASGGDIFQVEPQYSGAGYTAGFIVP